MSAALYGRDSSGVTRQIKKLYASAGGVTRELKELWARDSGGVNRKIFSGYDCRAKIIDYKSAGVSHLNADGSGDINLYSTYYNSDPSVYHVTFSIQFDNPILVTKAGEKLRIDVTAYSVNHIRSPYYPIISLQDADTGSYILTSVDGPEGKGIYTNTRLINSDVWVSNFLLEISANLEALDYDDAWSQFSWPVGGLSLCGVQLNNIELI